MFLSRLVIPPNKLGIKNALQEQHKTFTQGLQPDEPRYLFRVDTVQGNLVALVQSHKRCNWAPLEGQGYQCDQREFEPRFQEGQRFLFKARLNCCKRDIRTGKWAGIGGEARQVEWLMAKATKFGFEIQEANAVDERVLGDPERPGLVIRSVVFDGILRVADPALFDKTFRDGFGKGKAFGFGMLSLRAG